MITTAATVFFITVMAHHLGLVDAIGRLVRKVLSCPMCTVFWTCLMALLMTHARVVPALGLSMFLAYATLWTMPLLEKANQAWQRLRRRSPGSKSRRGAE